MIKLYRSTSLCLTNDTDWQIHVSTNLVYIYCQLHIPIHYKNFYKFWWTEELNHLKDNAIESDKVWKAAGRPRSGPIAYKRNADKMPVQENASP